MKTVLALLVCACVAAAQCPPPASFNMLPTNVKVMPATYTPPTVPVGQSELASTADELNFLINGPRLFPMNKATELSSLFGRPVLCWMGPHLFADPRARALSEKLGASTLQAAMDTDEDTGKLDPKSGKRIPVYRVKFSTGNYKDGDTVLFIPLERMDEPGIAEKILAKARGGR